MSALAMTMPRKEQDQMRTGQDKARTGQDKMRTDQDKMGTDAATGRGGAGLLEQETRKLAASWNTGSAGTRSSTRGRARVLRVEAPLYYEHRSRPLSSYAHAVQCAVPTASMLLPGTRQSGGEREKAKPHSKQQRSAAVNGDAAAIYGDKVPPFMGTLLPMPPFMVTIPPFMVTFMATKCLHLWGRCFHLWHQYLNSW
eukprot:3074585-Rhodomonas_salina.1